MRLNKYMEVVLIMNRILFKKAIFFCLETTSLNFAEKFINCSILGFFYILFLLTFPLSLFVCLKHVKKNEKFVVYRLGRLIQPAYETGYYILFPLIDNYQRYTITQKEFTLPNLQVFTYFVNFSFI